MADQAHENQHVQETPAATNGTNVTAVVTPAAAVVAAPVDVVVAAKQPESVASEDKKIVVDTNTSTSSAPVVTATHQVPPVAATPAPVTAAAPTAAPAAAPVVVAQQQPAPQQQQPQQQAPQQHHQVPVQVAEPVVANVTPIVPAPVAVEQPKKRPVEDTLPSSSTTVVEPEKKAKVAAAPAPAPVESGNEEPGYAYTCDYCQEYIQEARYHCAVCPDFDLCANCKSEVFDDHKAAHTVTKIDIPLEQ